MNNTAPVISVITIVKNNEKLLPRAVNSVLNQTFTDFEHIIVNDGSTDRTGSIIDKYSDKDARIQPLHLPRNVGRAMARNRGMDTAKGRYIFFLDSDDYLPKSALMYLYEVAEEDNADIVYGRIKSFDQLTGNWLPRHYTDPLIEPENHCFCLDDNPKLINDHSIIGRLYRREMLQKNNVAFSTVRKNAEDVLFSFYSSFFSKRLSTIPKETVYFYNAGNYFTTANEVKLFDARDNILETLNFVLLNGSSELKKRMRRKAVMFAGHLQRAQKVYEGDKDKFISYIRTLAPLVEGLPEDILNGLPPYHRKFTKALLADDLETAYLAWRERDVVDGLDKISINRKIEELRLENKKLARQLDALYNSNSWRITAPLRLVVKKFISP